MFTVKVDTSGMRRALENFRRELHEAAQESLRQAAREAQTAAILAIKAQTKRHTGDLEDNWGQVWLGPYELRLKNFSGHADFIEKGTKPHRIQAKRARALAFQAGGRTIFRRVVNHPGTTPRPFIALAMASGQMALRDSATQAVDRLAKAI